MRRAAAIHPLPSSFETRPPGAPQDEGRRQRRDLSPPSAPRRCACSLASRAKRRRQHLAHHRVVVARRQRRALDVEGAVLVLHEAFRPGDDHRADRVGPHDVRIVVDLDPPRRRCEAEGGGERREQLRLARRFGELARQRLARVAQRVVDELLLFAAARRADGDAMAGARARRPRATASREATSWLSSTSRGAGRSR